MPNTISRRAFVAGLSMLSIPVIVLGQEKADKAKEKAKNADKDKEEKKKEAEEKKEDAKEKVEDRDGDRRRARNRPRPGPAEGSAQGSGQEAPGRLNRARCRAGELAGPPPAGCPAITICPEAGTFVPPLGFPFTGRRSGRCLAASTSMRDAERPILIVEDDPSTRVFLAELLQSHGYSVMTAA